MDALERLVAPLSDRRLPIDAGVALMLVVLSTALERVIDPYPYGPEPTGLSMLLLVVPLAARRVWPVTSAVVVFSLAALQLLAAPSIMLTTALAVLLSLYSVTVYGPRWASWVAIGSVFAGASLFLVQMTLGVMLGSTASTSGGVLIIVTGLAVWAFGLLRRSRELRLEALRDRADRLEREREQQAELAAAAERARIAREMHDVVAHSLSVVIAQADGGRYAAETEPGTAVRALDTIGETGRAALADMRRILGVLRADAGSAPAPAPTGPPLAGAPPPPGTTPFTSTPDGLAADPALAPQPATGDLEPLVDQMRQTGMRISLVRLGTSRILPPGMGLTIYRIAQESLTNVLKHAGPEPDVTVLQRWEPGSLVLEVTDDGRGAAADDDAGHGLIGMRERVALFGGALDAGPRPGGGFRVRAELPLPVEASDRLPAAGSPTSPEPAP